jgi:hypothetical protein
MGSSEHSDNADLPTVFSEYCLNGDMPMCAVADDDMPANSFRKWDATLEYARAASDESFTGFRGFEWTADVFGHINVYFSDNDENAKTDGGYGVTMATFWEWFTRDRSLGGGSDGIATFNHPGDKCSLGKMDPTCDWNQFEYVPAADQRMVGIELFNGRKDFGQYYVQALDKGWHVGAVGAEDKGHDKADRWGSSSYAKTVMLFPTVIRCEIVVPYPDLLPRQQLTCAEQRLHEAMLARRTYGVLDNTVRIQMDAGGEPMGARISRPAGSTVPLTVSATGDTPARIEIVTTGGTVVASGLASGLSYDIPVTGGEHWYFARILDAVGKPQAYSSPVWVSG